MPPSRSTTTLNKRLVRSALTTYARSPETLFSLAHPKITFHSHLPTGWFKFGGRHKGAAGIRTYLARIAREFRVVNYKLVDLTAEGDRVWSLSRGEFKSLKNGKRVKLELVGRWILRNGKIIAWEEFTDTAGALIQEGRLAKRETKRKESA